MRSKLFKILEYLQDDKLNAFFLRVNSLTSKPDVPINKMLKHSRKIIKNHRYHHLLMIKEEVEKYSQILETAFKLPIQPAVFFLCDVLKLLIERNKKLDVFIFKWILNQFKPADFTLGLNNLIKQIVDGWELNVNTIYYFLKQRDIELDENLFDLSFYNASRKTIKQLFSTVNDRKDNDNCDNSTIHDF
eukprot:CAMPEP_0116976606 /NCGR_PEP_ID=MMETSP0467-20121206/56605_1 /TAXON_ID=283647 /ORGANISM="Mesodinium pulex, Strain SPMC105" /LENGTH=188 /DNA_ID=CAMNT_0004669455 /DNA_START=773 /DNA_END=1339 /DNA_ORIENTATION=+